MCLDRSPLSEAGLPYAIFLARTFGSRLTLLHVMQPMHEDVPHTTDALGWEIARHEASAYLERLQEQAARASGQTVDTRLEQGHPADRISSVARQLRADVTVLGSHGHGGATAWHLGSTVQQVLAVARTSVLVVRPGLPDLVEVAPKRILVPLDGSVRTESVLPVAARVAQTHGAELLLAHVVLEPLPSAMLTAVEDLELARHLASRLEAGAKRYLEQLRAQLPRDIKVRTVVIRHPDQRQSLLELSRREQSDLVVLSAHGAICNRERSFGSVALYMLTHSKTPLLVLQDLPEAELADEAGQEPAPPLRASYPPEGP